MQPQMVGEYSIIKELGQGGGATVYEATNANGLTVALKVVTRRENWSGDEFERWIQRLAHERSALERCKGPRVVQLLDAGESAGSGYLALELLAGPTARVWLSDPARFPLIKLPRVLLELAEALDRCHSQSVVHADVSLGNIVLSEGRGVVLIDFGSSVIDGLSLDSVVGTPSFMSPEQIRPSLGVDARADQFVLGSIAYMALIGQDPFVGDDSEGVLQAIKTGPLPAVPDEGSQYRAAFDKVFQKAPEERFPSCRHFVAALFGLG